MSRCTRSGLYLARGDRRAHVAVTFEGEVLSLSRLTGRKTKEVAARLGKADELRSVEETKEHIAAAITPKLRHLLKENARAQSRDMAPLEARRLVMRDQHRERRHELDQAQRQRSEVEGQTRAARLRRGVVGLWDRLTGKRKETLRQNETETTQCRTRDRAERHELIAGQLDERRGLQRETVAVRSRFADQAEELHRDLKLQDPSHEAEEPSLSSSFNDSSSASEAPSAVTPRILRGRSASRSAREHGGPEF